MFHNYYLIRILNKQQMKHSLFKIRKLGELDTKHNQQNDSQMKKSSQLDALKNTVQTTNDKMLQLMGFFETFLKSQTNDHPSSHLSTAITQGNLLQDITKDQKQFRDRHIYIPLPKNTQVSQKQMEIWMTEVYTAAFSTSFHYYLTEQLTFQQTKVFCSQNILRNLLLFTQRFKLNDKQIKNLNKHAGQEVLQYLQKKYPLTQSNDVNRALQKEIQQTNHLDMMVNDFLFIHGIMFKYREDGNYNDLIMKVINKAIQIAEQPSKMTSYNEQKKKYDQQSNYTDFQNYMANLFENVFDEAWMNGSKTKVQKLQSDATKIAKKINSESHKEKYEQKVRSYTNYLIGRKLSQNTVPFSQQQILGKNLVIKSPAILRILTKWCEQLWQKFENQTYFTERAQPIQLQDQQTINPFFKWMKTSIQKRTAQEKKSIILFKADLDNNNYSLQADYLIKHLASDNNTSILKYEKASGKFAVHMVKNLHSYVILYLNRLIHGLVTVSKNFQDKQIDKSWTQWQTPLNLLTFKIGDFLRCRISSRQKEIVSIFKELKSISNINPQKLKIIRIKNRLRRGTNDILINIKFNNLIVCEIQLEVINKSKTKFIQCSNSFSHYIYQMKRSIFGPVSQLCNIWNNLEARALQYEQHLRQINEQVRQELKCTNEQNKHNFVVFKLPFQCSYCLRIFYHNNYILQNKKCNICLTYKCVKCEINDTPEQQLKKIFFMKKSQQQLAKSCKKSIGKTRVKVGICFKIESYVRVPQIFKIHTIEGRTWILSKRGDKIYSIKKIRSNKDYEEFSQNYCVFQIINNELNFIKIDAKAAQNFGAQQYLIESYKQQKEVLILTQLRFTVAQMEKLMKIDGGYQKNKKKIKRIQFASNYVDSIAYFSAFENLTSINLDYNDFSNMKQLSYFPKLQKLEFRDNSKLEQFSEEVCELTRLEQIKITTCKIKSLPETISKLTALQILKMDLNSLKELPDSICSLSNLKQLSLSKNTFSKLPTQFGNLVNLKKLNLKGCNLTQLPVSFGKLENLTALDLSNNKITILPNNLLYLTCIQTLRLNNNQLSIFPQNFPFTQSLQILSLNNNHFTNLPNNFAACKNLSILNLHANSITQIPSTLQNCFNISQLTLQNNKIKEIPQWFQNLGKLPNKQIILHNNCISVFPSFIFELDDVVKIDLSANQITAIPQRISQLQTLQTLNLKTNKITTLAAGLSKIQKLKIFEITNNLIEQLPIHSKDIAQNKNNPNFFINYQMNKISKIEAPELFDAIVTNFQLPNNCLIQIPTQLRKYKDKIKIISLSHNLIKEIPRWISEFTSLTSLYLADNQIELIPKQIEDLTYPRLSTLGLQRNPITVIECVQFVKRYPFYRLLNLDSVKAPQVKPIVKDKDDDEQDD